MLEAVASTLSSVSLSSSKLQALPHPLSQLSIDETVKARDTIIKARGSSSVLQFRSIYLEEPAKDELRPFLAAEQRGQLKSYGSRPARLARVQYDVIHPNKAHEYTESLVDVNTATETVQRQVGGSFQSAAAIPEFKIFEEACNKSHLLKDAIAEFELPEGFVVTIDPWPYGGPDPEEVVPRHLQGLCFARDARSENPDANHYGYPLPIIPVMDCRTREIFRVDKCATGGKDDHLGYRTPNRNVIDHCAPSDYVPELLREPQRKDLKPLNVVQPEGPSFKVSDDSLVEWQKWKFIVGFTPREGAILHNVTYDGRPVLYRMSFSEMTVPYGDPRPPYHRKQAFDFGDGGAGRSANNLQLGCDCLGVIKYLDALSIEFDGTPTLSKNVVCIHEQDNGIGWKHTNFRTGRAVVTRSRELVVQFIITLANYEYVFAYKFDQAGGINVEVRATGVVSVVNIDPGKTSAYGNVVAPGAMAQNHQHIFCVRIDPSVDGAKNTIVKEETLPLPMEPDINPWGNGYQVVNTPVTKPTCFNASPSTNLTVKMINPSHTNPISGKPVAYKFIPSATQLLLAHPDSIVAKRAQFAQHHVWVTKYKDGELWAGGEFTNQSKSEKHGVRDAIARGETFDKEGDDVVVWNVFGLTHNPRVEDWPVMPVEIHNLHIKPADFFTQNPALDVPSSKNLASVLTNGSKETNGTNGTNGDCCNGNGIVQQQPEAHWQGDGQHDITPNGTTGANGANGVHH